MINTENSRSSDALHEQFLDYAAYVLTSARALYREPQTYGPMRLADALEKVLELLRAAGMEDKAVDGAMAVIRESRPFAMTDPERFTAALDGAISKLVEATLDQHEQADES